MTIRFGPRTYLTRIAIVTTLERMVDCEAAVRLIDHGEEDGIILAAADRRAGYDAEEFCAQLADYDRRWPDNSYVVTTLMLNYQAMQQGKLAEVYALRAAALGQAYPAIEIYDRLRCECPWHHTEAFIAGLRDQLGEWDLEGHHGLVTLDLRRSFLIAANGVERERYHAVKMVRRRAAARKFRQVEVPMVALSGGLAFTAARVVRADGKVVDLEKDRFSIGSAEDDDPLVAVARRQSGTWILPDLERDDIIEYAYDLVRLRESGSGDQSHFILANFADPGIPTLGCQVSFTAPRRREMAFALHNAAENKFEEIEQELDNKTTVFKLSRVLPRHSHSQPYQRYMLNPVVGCATREGEWADVADRLLGEVRRLVEATTAVPVPLAEAIGETTDPHKKLARAFYWIRDHIKYGSVASANEALEDPDRAERIVATGTADCKDMSFLLAVVCNRHGIPWEFVLLATKRGLILEELPADQFDHVIVRAQIDGEWLYLDAVSEGAIFSGLSAFGQGLTGLAGGDTGGLITLPEQEAEANQVRIHETLETIEGGWLIARVDVVVTGLAARALEEASKHQSLTGLDPDRNSDIVAHSLLPDIRVTEFNRLQGTGDSDTLQFSLTGRRSKLIPLGGESIATFGLGVPLLPFFPWRGTTYNEQFVFPLKARIEYRLEIGDGLQGALSDLSTIESMDSGFCTIVEEPLSGSLRSGFVRRVALTRRIVAGAELERLPELIERLDDLCRVVARFALTA